MAPSSTKDLVNTKTLLLLGIASLLGCSRASSPQSVGYDAGDRDGLGSPIGSTCAHLRSLGCPEGFVTRAGRTCFEHMTSLDSFSTIPYHCINEASSPEAVRDCGNTSDVRIRCYMPSVTEAGSALP
jgi:hypothetical protein